MSFVNRENSHDILANEKYPILYAYRNNGDVVISTEKREEDTLLFQIPNMTSEIFGDPEFKKEYGLKYALYGGAMANGIASSDMVIALGRAGFMGSYGAGGMSLNVIAEEIDKIKSALGGKPYMINMLSNRNADAEMQLATLLIEKEVPAVEASAYIVPSDALLYYRLKGICRNETGKIVIPRKIIAKVSREEVLEKLEPNQELLKTILQLKHLMKGEVLETAKKIVAKVAKEISEKMEQDIRRSVIGRVDRNSDSKVKSMRNLDIKRTIRKNLQNYDTENKRLVLEQVYFNSRVKNYNKWRVVIAVDESGSMLDCVIHSAIMAGIFAKLPMLDTKLVIFDTQVVDLSGQLEDPVETLMSIQLGGGTDIAGALVYCETLIENPHRTIVVLVSDLCEGGSTVPLYTVSRSIIESGAKLIALTALDLDAKPSYDRNVGQKLADLGAYVGAMTPEQLGDFVGKVMK